MTRKQRAIKNLKQMCSDGRYLGSGSYTPLEVLEDFNLAIKALEQEPTAKNNLGVDCVSRQFMYDLGATCIATRNGNGKLIALGAIEELPSVTPQLLSELDKNSKELEKDFGELDCISRKAILDELEKWDWQELYLPIHFKQMLDELPAVTPQEPFINKPCISSGICEHDKQNVLDKVYAEIEELQRDMLYASKVEFNDIYKILDKYKAESEGENDN